MSTETPSKSRESDTPTTAPEGRGGPASSEEAAVTIRQLNWIRNVAILDFLFLIPLLYASFTDNDGLVSILGPIHGIGFLILMYLCVKGVGEGRWGWWFPAIVVVTLGPPGSLYGEWRIRRELDAPS